MKSKTTIEVNGKRYDAITGAVIGNATAPLVNTGRNIDGFFRARVGQPTPVHARVAEKAVVAAPAPKPEPRKHRVHTASHVRAHAPQTAAVVSVRRQAGAPVLVQTTAQHSTATINHAKPHAVQGTKTLVRSSVQRPAPSFHTQAKPTAALQHSVPSLIVTKASARSIDPTRLVRAQDIPRSPHITHHSGDTPNLFATIAPLAVQPAPPIKPGSEDPVAPAPTPTNKPVDTHKPTDIFEHALANATHFVDTHARTLHFKKQVRRHMASMAAGSLALVVIASFAAYQNTPGLQFKVASMRAGVSTSMPNFEKAGFAYNGARSENGKLTVGFTGKQGNYQLVQRTTNLTGDEVVQNIGSTTASGKPTYQTIQEGSTTIYRFSNTDATWVSNGTWYTVNGTGALSDEQISSLARNI